MKKLIIASALLLIVPLPAIAQYPIEMTIWEGKFKGENIRTFWHTFGNYTGWESETNGGVIHCDEHLAKSATGDQIDPQLEKLLVTNTCN